MDFPALCQSKDRRRGESAEFWNPTKVEMYCMSKTYAISPTNLGYLGITRSFVALRSAAGYTLSLARISENCQQDGMSLGYSHKKTHAIASHVVDWSKDMQQLMQLAPFNRNCLTCFWKCRMMIWLFERVKMHENATWTWRAGHVPFWPLEINSTPKPGGFSPCYRCKFAYGSSNCRFAGLSMSVTANQLRFHPNTCGKVSNHVEHAADCSQGLTTRWVWWCCDGRVAAWWRSCSWKIPTSAADSNACWTWPIGHVATTWCSVTQCGWWSWEWCHQDGYEWEELRR